MSSLRETYIFYFMNILTGAQACIDSAQLRVQAFSLRVEEILASAASSGTTDQARQNRGYLIYADDGFATDTDLNGGINVPASSDKR